MTHRELGLWTFGNPQEFDVPSRVGDMLYYAFVLYGKVLRLGKEFSPSYGHDFPDGMELVVRPYDWGWEGEDEDMLPNVEFGDVRIWWYKYLGRSMTTDRELTDDEWTEWFLELFNYISTLDFRPARTED